MIKKISILTVFERQSQRQIVADVVQTLLGSFSMINSDRQDLPALLAKAQAEALRFLDGLDTHPVAHDVPLIDPLGLPEVGVGADAALDILRERYGPWWSGSPGPRYFGFVTGGATPAALVGDWLASAYDQNLSDAGESGARQLALDALGMVRSLLGLPDTFQGAFVTGATASSTVALAAARQWVGRERGTDVTTDGVHALGPVVVLSGTAHSSISKALSIVGLGRSALQAVPVLPEREAVDVSALGDALAEVEANGSGPAIVVANSGTVNTCDFDDLQAIASLRDQYRFWLHVDGAFGAVAAASPRYRALLDGLEGADSITVDAHKWLNVPYDCGVVLTQHLELQGAAFQSAGAYLPPEVAPDTFLHLTPENSQRLRALSVWMTLAAYGSDGYSRMVERCCDLAAQLGKRIESSDAFRLLAPVRLNGVCFTLSGEPSTAAVGAFLTRLRESGAAFLTGTTYRGVPAARVSITNWRTEEADLEATWTAMLQAAQDSGDG
ncbi:MAG: pyridoxal-dependent decarboxylase [Acidobacteriota bacterium]|nr:pyridoxal-dependent decarboxylase [Acidobacteriota bacterium]